MVTGLIWGLSSAVQAQTYTNSYGIWYYSPNDNNIYGDGTCTVREYIGPGGAVIIPNIINGLTVVNIGDYGTIPQIFFDPSVTKVTIPDSVINIDWHAFFGCTNLTGVIIPDSVTNIDHEAFAACTSLTNVVIPDSVTSIGYEAFDACTSLKSVTIGNGVTIIGGLAFGYCLSLTNIAIPDSVTIIAGGYFHFEQGAFEDCASLASITIGSGVTNIEDYAFGNCPALTSVFFQGNAPTADSTIFTNDNVTNITVYTASGTTGWDVFAGTVGVVTAPQFGSTAYGGLPILFYPPSGTNNTLQMSTNPASGNWVAVSNPVTLAALQLTNAPSSAFFRLQSSASSTPDAGLSFYFGQPVLFYPTNAGYSPQMSTNFAGYNWRTPSGNAFVTVQVTNAPPNAVFRLH